MEGTKQKGKALVFLVFSSVKIVVLAALRAPVKWNEHPQ